MKQPKFLQAWTACAKLSQGEQYQLLPYCWENELAAHKPEVWGALVVLTETPSPC